MDWLSAHWRDLLLTAIAVDSVFIPIFPPAGIIASVLKAVAGVSQDTQGK